MPMKPIELDDLVSFRLSTKQRAAVEAYAKSIEAPRSYALRRLVAKGLQGEQENEAA
jgi:hypothetical protein